MWIVAVFITISYSGFGKPIWIDEFLHFAFGAMDTSEAVATLNGSLGAGVNWGQTPTMFMLDHILLTNFGANLWVLRLPSAIAGFLLIMLAVYFLRLRGIGRTFQWLMIAAFAAQGNFMAYVGEARPFMLMASTAVALLVFFSLDLKQRRTWLGVLIGVYAIAFGAMVHPYWVIFLVLTVIFGLSIRGLSVANQYSFRIAIKESSPIWIGIGIVIYAVTAITSWAKAQSTFTTNPYEFVESPLGAVRLIVSTHFQFLELPTEWGIPYLPPWQDLFNIPRILIFMLIATTLVYLIRSNVKNRKLLAPLVLLGFGVFSTLAFSLLTLHRSYWIVQRQWLGGIALSTVAIIWLIAVLWNRDQSNRRNFGSALALLVTLVIACNAIGSLSRQIEVIRTHNDAFLEFQQETRDEEDLIQFARESGSWVYVANVNAVRGGKVWRGLTGYYGINDK
jgi:MFS family permease